jgi:o-succinylbenzoate synthase
VIIQRLGATRIRIPLRDRFVTAHGTLAARESWIITLESDDGAIGVGEAAPLAGHSLPPGPPVDGLLDKIRSALPLPLAALPRPLGATASEAAVRFAIETAELDLSGTVAERPLVDLLGGGRPAVPVNAVIDATDDDEVVARARGAAQTGFGTIKLKVGTRPLREEERRLARIREAIGSSIRLRLDANGAWNEATATSALSLLRRFHIEFVEQPVPPHHFAVLRRVRQASAIPIAADEDVWSPEAGRQLLDAEAVDLLVLKPMVLGGLRAALALAQEAHAHGVRCVVTTTIDSGVATAAALHLAAAIPGPLPACGLATTSLLETDLLVQPLAVVGGVMSVPRRPGLGIAVDAQALQRFAVREAGTR